MQPARRALISVFDKEGVVEFARGLHRRGIEILSTGGTQATLDEAGVPARSVSEVTDFPEILGGRVKSLHPLIHGGILADRGDEGHLEEVDEHEITLIDIVVVNLYPFRRTVEDPEASRGKIIEMIDIGGPAMIRAAAKNFRNVIVLVDPADYEEVQEALKSGDNTIPEDLRRRLAAKAFRHTHEYDAAVAAWFASGSPTERQRFPETLLVELRRRFQPRYGENPHQDAAVYRDLAGSGLLGGYDQLQGKELSWNNLLDADAARKLVALFDEPTVAIIKHNNPCGVGRGETVEEAFRRALATDPVSAFGSVIALNRPADRHLAASMNELFVEVVVAPEFGPGARKKFAAKKNLRLLACPVYEPGEERLELRSIAGGFLAQEPDCAPDDPTGWDCPTKQQPKDEERRALAFAWAVARHVKSNAIVVANEHQTVGIGAGQMSRVDSCRLAVEKAELELEGAVAASDAFFPFRDGLDVLAEAGVTAVVQPGGSKRDEEVVAAADEHGIAMLLTGRRHFKH